MYICQGKSILQNQVMQQIPGTCSVHLEAFDVDDRGAQLIILLLADPHLLEGAQQGQDGATNPHYLPSWETMILIFIMLGARVVVVCILSAMPGYMVVPPDSTVLAYRSLRISTSHFMMELKVVSWIPQDSMPRKCKTPFWGPPL